MPPNMLLHATLTPQPISLEPFHTSCVKWPTTPPLPLPPDPKSYAPVSSSPYQLATASA